AGFSEGSGIYGDSDSDLARRLDGIKAAGGRWLRIDVMWSGIEGTRGSFNWSEPDRLVNAATAGGIQVLAILDFTPSWARPAGTSDHWGPTATTAFANFAKTAVNHYRGKVS